ncbi:MAG: type II toxin-antitoxin system RelE/ParE family toxin [Actinobacteria bacterium]|nr:type II toxin-antitoxin system RelE/ParE family toxin [Actinomycetota bacterium]
MTRLELGRRAQADAAELPWSLAEQTNQALTLLETDPRAGQPLRDRLRGVWSLRIGAYRILYQIVDDGRTVRVLTIRHRSVAYRSDPR